MAFSFTSDNSENSPHVMSVQHASLTYNGGSVSKQPTRWLHAIEAKPFFKYRSTSAGKTEDVKIEPGASYSQCEKYPICVHFCI